MENMQRSTVEDMARRDHRLSKPGALWKAGVELSDLLDEDGQIDPEKVKTAVTTAISDLGLNVERSGAHVPAEGRIVDSPKAEHSWQGFLSKQ